MPPDLTAWLPQAALLFGVALVGGALNSLAGGGSFLTFPALMLVGVPSVNANATNTVALWPSGLAILSVYRRELRAVPYRWLLLAPSVIGGWLGAVVLLRTPSATFERLVPYLLLAATALFAFSGPIAAGWAPPAQRPAHRGACAPWWCCCSSPSRPMAASSAAASAS